MIPSLGWEHYHGKTQYIPGKQVLVSLRLWKTKKQAKKQAKKQTKTVVKSLLSLHIDSAFRTPQFTSVAQQGLNDTKKSKINFTKTLTGQLYNP